MKFTSQKKYFSPYQATDSFFSEEEFRSTYQQSKENILRSITPDGYGEYTKLVDFLHSLKNSQLVPVKDLMCENKDGKKMIAIRFDIDQEPFTAIRLARFNARFGIPSSFYLLHTAYYYGQMKDGVFHRNPLMRSWIKSMIVAGCEIGLHNDALSLYKTYKIDGAQAIIEEIKWLRLQEVKIFGTAAHNSFPVYGAENFEVFKDHLMWKRNKAETNKNNYDLGVLDEKSLDLVYEANFPKPVSDLRALSRKRQIKNWLRITDGSSVESSTWMRTYLVDNPCYKRAHDVTVWHHGNDKWSIGINRDMVFKKYWFWKIDRQHMFQLIKNLPENTRIIFHLHPIYFSKDTMGTL